MPTFSYSRRVKSHHVADSVFNGFFTWHLQHGWLPSQINPHQQPTQSLDQQRLTLSLSFQINSRHSPPHLSRRQPMQMLMRSYMVIKQGKFMQRHLQCTPIRNHQLFQQRLQGTEQTLNPAILPGSTHLRLLMFNSRQP